MRHVLIVGLAAVFLTSGAIAAPSSAAKPAKPAQEPKPAITSMEAERNKSQATAEKRQRDWDRKAATSMKSICSNC